MSSKKGNKRNSKKTRVTSSLNGVKLVRVHGDEPVLPLVESGEDSDYRSVRLNPETAEEREKRLAARKARTLRIFQKAYENQRQQRKAS